MIPLVDLKAQYEILKSDLDCAIMEVLQETAFVRGRHVDSFEKAYAVEYGVKHCISVASGTDAIYISLKMLGMGPGDEVITAANSWIATSASISRTGAMLRTLAGKICRLVRHRSSIQLLSGKEPGCLRRRRLCDHE